MTQPSQEFNRREFLGTVRSAVEYSLAAAVLPQFSGCAPVHNEAVGEDSPEGLVIAAGQRFPGIPFGIQSGDTQYGSAVVLAHSDRPARMEVEWSDRPDFKNLQRVIGPLARPEDAFSVKVILSDLPEGKVHYRVRFRDIDNPVVVSPPLEGVLWTPARAASDITIVATGDTAGQGFGIGTHAGYKGMLGYRAMHAHEPEVLLHLGDNIYADNPVHSEIRLPDGVIWKNVTTELKSKVAETQSEFHGNWQYMLLDPYLLDLYRNTSVIALWDDHEVSNNWYPGEILDDARYTEKNASLLAARGLKAFHDFTPTRREPEEPGRIYRTRQLGPLVDLFAVDMRSYRGANDILGSDPQPFFGRQQLAALKNDLLKSTATWKLLAFDMPVGLQVKDGTGFDNLANGDGSVRGREHEFAELLEFAWQKNIRNLVVVTADVHYAAVHQYAPERAAFKRFNPFYEIVTGPIHAGAFGPNELDNTFGPAVLYQSRKPGEPQNEAPTLDNQFFAALTFKKEGQLEVSLRNARDTEAYRLVLTPE